VKILYFIKLGYVCTLNIPSTTGMDLDQIYWYFKLGKPKHRATIYDIRNSPGNFINQPVFFLSTGRCGTKWFSKLLSYDPQFAIFHQPIPSLAIQSKVVYELLLKKKWQLSIEEEALIKEIFWSAREEYLRYTYKTGKRYIETNNYITFFAPVLKMIFPDALFIHLVRHPGEFVRSGIDRNYYSRANSDDHKRIEPVSGPYADQWDSLSRIGKTSWLWKETNSFVKEFQETIPADQFRAFNFNQLSSYNIQQILKFINSEISPRKVEKLIPKRLNAQRTHQLKSFDHWEEEEKNMVMEITGDLAGYFGYSK